MLHSIKEQDDTDKKYLYENDLSEPKYKFLIKKREDAETKYFSNSNTKDDVYENIDGYNQNKQRKNLTVFDDIFVDIVSDEKFQAII